MAALRILILQGHPDPAGDHLCHALAAIGLVESLGDARRRRRLDIVGALGRRGV